MEMTADRLKAADGLIRRLTTAEAADQELTALLADDEVWLNLMDALCDERRMKLSDIRKELHATGQYRDAGPALYHGRKARLRVEQLESRLVPTVILPKDEFLVNSTTSGTDATWRWTCPIVVPEGSPSNGSLAGSSSSPSSPSTSSGSVVIPRATFPSHSSRGRPA